MTDNLVLDIKSRLLNRENIFISGPGGTGKSYLVKNTILQVCNDNKLTIAVTSTTGVSALGVGGQTVHRWSGIKLGKESAFVICKRIRENGRECRKRWTETDVLVIDEISMLGQKTFELLDAVGRNLRGCKDRPFGGLTLVVTGDFLQLPPVNDEFCFKSPTWDQLDLTYYRLTEPKRFPDINHFELLQRARVGKLSGEDIEALRSRTRAYTEYIGGGGEGRDSIKPTRIFSLKKDVEAYNLAELEKLPRPERVYKPEDIFTPKTQGDVLKPEEIADYQTYLDTIIPPLLTFRVGAQVMLTYNISVDDGLVNGSRGVVREIRPEGLVVAFRNGVEMFVPPIKTEYEDSRVKIIRAQVPFILAWGISIHKCQGATLDYAIVDIGNTIFAPGMAYVALSRVKTLDGVYISCFNSKRVYADESALEFEYLIEDMAVVAGMSGLSLTPVEKTPESETGETEDDNDEPGFCGEYHSCDYDGDNTGVDNSIEDDEP